jgi:putative flippase GtrA
MYNSSIRVNDRKDILEKRQGIVRRLWERRIVRFLCVGTLNTLLDFTVLNLLVMMAHFPELAANGVSVSVGITASYFLNHRVVFRHPQKYAIKSFVRFFLVTGIGAIVIQNTVLFLAGKTGYAHSASSVHFLLSISEKTLVLNVAKAIAVVFGLVWNFLLYKYFIFSDGTQSDDELIVA